MPHLLIHVRFHDGRYHGRPEWPPSPARLFQALVAGAAQGAGLTEEDKRAFAWLENLEAPIIVAPPMRAGQGFRNFVPNNDADSLGGDLSRIGTIRAPKLIRPILFEAESPLLYVWAFAAAPEAETNAGHMCLVAEHLYQCGRGVDMAWAWGEVLEEGDVEARLAAHGGPIYRPGNGTGGTILAAPFKESLKSLIERHEKARTRFQTLYEAKPTKKDPNQTKAVGQIFQKPPEPRFREVAYNSPPTRLLFDLVGERATWRLDRIVALTECMRDAAAQRLKDKLPHEAEKIHNVIVGRRDAGQADKAARLRIIPLPSIGHPQADRVIRRIVVEIPPNNPLRRDDLEWAFSGLEALEAKIDADGEVHDQLVLASAADRRMLEHYGIEPQAPAHLWRTVTPAALPQSAARRRIDPIRLGNETKRGLERIEAKGGSERANEEDVAARAVVQALRHAGVVQPPLSIQVQREPFEGKGARAEAFADGSPFAKERLWHVEIAFAEPVRGPLVLGDGRYLGLGLFAPVRETRAIFSFALNGPKISPGQQAVLAAAARRAVMARVQDQLGNKPLPAFFTGHEPNGAPARPGHHAHLFYAIDRLSTPARLLILAPHRIEHRDASNWEQRCLGQLDEALTDFAILRAGHAGLFKLSALGEPADADRLCGLAQSWVSATPYRPTRHPKRGMSVEDALVADVLSECARRNLPRPDVKIVSCETGPREGIQASIYLVFRSAVEGPIMLGRDAHESGGMFKTEELSSD